MNVFDKIIIGGGFYGLYAALYCGKNGENVLLLEKNPQPFMCASYINQARVHMGYHYPRSISTAIKSKNYFDRFNEDFRFCINDDFQQVYAISSAFSWTNSEQFIKFCKDSDIYYEKIHNEKYFKYGMCDGSFLTKEYAYDAKILCDWLLNEIEKFPNVKLIFSACVSNIENNNSSYIVSTDEDKYKSGFVLNTTYASINQIHKFINFKPFKIKYELCEIILCKVSDNLKNVGLTVMDGTFFSIMPFGKTGCHSLTSVCFTPHQTSTSECPNFECQKVKGVKCTPTRLGNCNECVGKPVSAYPYMSKLAKKYLIDELGFKYISSLFSMKAVLKTSEIDDGRPTVIRKMSEKPYFYSVLSGKINTVYDLESVLNE